MISELYDRYGQVSIFPTQTTSQTNVDGTTILALTQISQTGTQFASKQADGSPGFRIKFKTEKVQEATASPCDIYIYNLAAANRAICAKENNLVILKAGYGNSIKQIYKGNIIPGLSRTTKQGPDYVTHIQASSGLYAFQNSRIDQAFNAGVKANQAITTLAQAIQKSDSSIGIGQITGVPNDGYNNGIVLSGNAIDQLKAICDGKNLSFYIHDHLIYIRPLGSTNGQAPLLINENSGLIGIPEITSTGISFKMLMNPDLQVMQPIVLESKFINGIFTTLKVVNEGDTFGGEWYSSVEATYPLNIVGSTP